MVVAKQLSCCLLVSNLSVVNFEPKLSSAEEVVFEATAKSSGPRSASDLVGRASEPNSGTLTKGAGFSFGNSKYHILCRE